MLKNKRGNNNKAKITILVSSAYVVVSLIIYIGSREDGTISNWLIQSLLGPVWHLSAFISVCKSPFNYIDGGFRISSEDILMAGMSLCIWLFGGSVLSYTVYTESKNIKMLCLVGLVLCWFLVGWFNVVLYGIYSL